MGGGQNVVFDFPGSHGNQLAVSHARLNFILHGFYS
jgi:hypothetical protein